MIVLVKYKCFKQFPTVAPFYFNGTELIYSIYWRLIGMKEKELLKLN